MDKRYCIFDMDGTLVDSMRFWQQLGREYLTRRGVTEGMEPVLERCKAQPIGKTAEVFLSAFHLAGSAEQVAQDINATMEHHYRTDVPLKPGAMAYLQALKARGVHLCVATATAKPLTLTCMTRLGVAELLDFVLSCEEVGAGKDNPAVFLEAARRFGAQPGDVAVFEDSIYAARTAKAAGFYTVGVFDSSGAAQWDELCSFADARVLDWRDVNGRGGER